MTQRLSGKRVIITQADDYMGPATAMLFAEHGADVISDTTDLTISGACAQLIDSAGRVDVLVANLAGPNFSGRPATDLDDAAWASAFDTMVHPLHRLTPARCCRRCNNARLARSSSTAAPLL